METLEQRIRKVFIKNGLWLGAILLALSIFSFYFITKINNSAVLFVAAPIIFSFVIPIALVVVFCFRGRKQIGGYWSFKQATTGIFIMFLIAYGIQEIGKDLVFAKIVEPQMIEKTEAAFLRASTQIKNEAGANKKRIDNNIAEIKKNFEQQKHITIGKTIEGILTTIIMIFVLAIIFGALFKRDMLVYSS